eukprot:TRINITY_DN49429_c0_g1_i1.p1 TRINITY_DN49429_c0_g1~~TRINITY_DN49429_c0_g1_i1.p1  ORF type:complete len:114 (+),score=7.73 TRINITY_DN49429_c0_g1_i1:35-376(+)
MSIVSPRYPRRLSPINHGTAAAAGDAEDEGEMVQHGGLTTAQVELFQSCVEDVRSAQEIAQLFRENFPGMSWSCVRAPTGDCDIHLESGGFAEMVHGLYTIALIANPKTDSEG